MERSQLAKSIAAGFRISRGLIGIYVIGDGLYEARIKIPEKNSAKRSRDLDYLVRWRNAMARKHKPGEPCQINDMVAVFNHFGVPIEHRSETR
jgi:hypothetical protein